MILSLITVHCVDHDLRHAGVHAHIVQPSIEQVHTHTNSLVKEVASLKEAVRVLSERNQRMEAALARISSVLETQFSSSVGAEQKS